MTKHKRVVIPGEIDAQKRIRRDRNVKIHLLMYSRKELLLRQERFTATKLKLLWNTEIIMELWNIRK